MNVCIFVAILYIYMYTLIYIYIYINHSPSHQNKEKESPGLNGRLRPGAGVEGPGGLGHGLDLLEEGREGGSRYHLGVSGKALGSS